MTSEAEKFVDQLASLCGREITGDCRSRAVESIRNSLTKRGKNATFGRRQLNEMLLLCNERIVSRGFFEFLAGRRSTISFSNFKARVREFHRLSMLQFGSFRFAFNFLHNKEDVASEFCNWIEKSNGIIQRFRRRQKPIRELEHIDEPHLHLLGYLTTGDDNPKQVKKVRESGQRNFETYLSYDYLDVYVATSMRERWEYVDVHRLCNQVFGNKRLRNINVRFFDPTQSFHSNSIAKGLIEGLMLKRARCTLYLVQESDTMGKDSEMASTLAQGKPVIAYVPKISNRRRKQQLREASLQVLLQKADLLRKEAEPAEIDDFTENVNVITRVMQQSGHDRRRRDGELRNHQKAYTDLINRIVKYESKFYDRRADTLKHFHPLRFQIDLNTGVANGVLVTRRPSDCANVIFKVLTNGLKFDILAPGARSRLAGVRPDDLNYRLIETTTGCAFRVVTKDEMLTNSFWNLYKRGDD